MYFNIYDFYINVYFSSKKNIKITIYITNTINLGLIIYIREQKYIV